MAQEIKIAGATYSGVPAVDFVDSSGGGHRYVDASPTTAQASDVASGKVFVDAAGNVVTGSAVIGGGVMAHYGSCDTAAGTAAKTVDCTGFTLITGALVFVKFAVTNTAANPTLNVSGTGAKAIQYRGAAISAGYLAANRTYAFVYDGTNYQLVGDLDTNTHYTTHLYAGSGAAANASTTNGNTKIAVADDSTVRNAVTIKGTGATTVTSDANGNITINSTDNNTVYTHPTSAGNKHIPAGGSSGQILRWSADGTAAWGADNNTTYSTMTGADGTNAGAAGLVPKPAATANDKFLRGDGKWATPTNTTYSSGTAANLTTGTDTTAKVWTSKILADYVKGTVSLAANGYYKDRNGLIIQWGHTDTGAGGTVTFPTSFSSAAYAVACNHEGGYNNYVTVKKLTKTNFTTLNSGDAGVGLYWVAVGK